MENVNYIELFFEVAKTLDEFCKETVCEECPIRELCNKMDSNLSLVMELTKNIDFIIQAKREIEGE